MKIMQLNLKGYWMNRRTVVSTQTRNNWFINAAVLVGGLLAAFSGVYFLFLPAGGYRFFRAQC